MRNKVIVGTLAFLVLGISLFFGKIYVSAQEKNLCINRELCIKMMQFGQEAYWRGKYLDAKQYFKRAIQADPTSEKAWRLYDLATIFALAEKVEKNMNLVAPDVSTRREISPSTSSKEQVKAPKKMDVPQQVEEFVIEDDEGC